VTSSSTEPNRPAIFGSYAAKQCPIVAQNDVLCPEEALPFPEAVRRRIEAGVVFEDDVLPPLRVADDADGLSTRLGGIPKLDDGISWACQLLAGPDLPVVYGGSSRLNRSRTSD
jgi:hypothetical protein